MHALTVVLNPNARKPRQKAPSIERMKELLGPRASVHLTQNLAELDRLMEGWTYSAKGDPERATTSEETICFYGGDGSIARGLTSLIRHHGEDFPLPPVLAVRAGTINMICSVLGFRQSVENTLSLWTKGSLTGTRSIPTLKVEIEGEPPHYGFVLAWGVGYRVLREYYDRRPVPGVWDGIAVAAKTFAWSLHPRAESLELFRGDDIGLVVDGQLKTMAETRSLIIGTISRVSLGLKPLPRGEIEPGSFHFSANGMKLVSVFFHSPSLLLGLADPASLVDGARLVAAAGVKSLECTLSNGFTMNGEMFDFQAPKKVRVSPGPVVRFWTLKSA